MGIHGCCFITVRCALCAIEPFLNCKRMGESLVLSEILTNLATDEKLVTKSYLDRKRKHL